MSNRLTGDDTTVQIYKGDVLQDELTLVKECTVTFEMDVSKEGYLGEKRDRPDGKFSMAKIEFTNHHEDAAWMDFYQAVVDKQMRKPGAPTSISMTANFLYPNGQVRSIVLERLEFESIPLTAGGRKDMVESNITAYADAHQFIN